MKTAAIVLLCVVGFMVWKNREAERSNRGLPTYADFQAAADALHPGDTAATVPQTLARHHLSCEFSPALGGMYMVTVTRHGWPTDTCLNMNVFTKDGKVTQVPVHHLSISM